MYSQKGTQRIEIVVRGEGIYGTGEQESATGNNNGSGERGKKQWAERRKGRILKMNALHALTTSWQLTKRDIRYNINGLGLKYGDQAMEDQIDRNVEMVEDIVGGVGGIIIGAEMGSFGGPIGVVVGATIGLANSAFNLLFKYNSREREYNMKVFKQENAIEYRRARAGTNLTFGRLR